MKHSTLSITIFIVFILGGCTTDNRETHSAALETQPVEGAIEVKYRTVTEGFDWGPAITKLIIDFGEEIESSELARGMLQIKSNRIYKDFNWATFSQSKEASPHIVSREVSDLYSCDEQGFRDPAGAYTALEMPVGPTRYEGSPFNFNFAKFLNEYIDTEYEISINGRPELKFEYTGNITLIADDFENDQEFRHGDITLSFASFTPETTSLKEGNNPLIIWLHGAGEGGNNTRIALLGNKVVNLAAEPVQKYFGETGAYVLVPQAPTMWMDLNGKGVYNISVPDSGGDSYYTEALMELVKDYVNAHSEIDKNRIYIGGCSNGGYMTVKMVLSYPDYFAAAFPISEAYSSAWLTDEDIQHIKDLPLWLTHARADKTVIIGQGSPGNGFGQYSFDYDETGTIKLNDDFSNNLYRRLLEAGAENVYYSLFEKVVDTTGLYKDANGNPFEYDGHWSWIYTLNNECVETVNGKELTIFEWLSQQSK